MEICIICNQICRNEYVKLGQKEKKPLLAASHERQDNLFEIIQKTKPLILHSARRKLSIKSDKRK